MKSDSEIKFAIKTELERNMETSVLDVDVTVDDGVVFLGGVVDVLGDKEVIDKVVREVADVKKVVNQISLGMERRVKDDELELTVEGSLVKKDEEFRKVGVVAKKGIVHLYGNIRTLAEEKDILSAAMEVLGVREVVSHLKKTVNREGEPLDDATIHNNVVRQLATDPMIDRGNIDVMVRRGKVFLEGTVAEIEEIGRALRLVSEAEGVRAISNNLRAYEGGTGGEEKLAVEIRRAWGEDGRVSPAQLRVYVEGDTVFLDGTVDSPDAREAAIEIAGRVVDGWPRIRGVQVGIHTSGAKGSVQKQRHRELVHH